VFIPSMNMWRMINPSNPIDIMAQIILYLRMSPFYLFLMQWSYTETGSYTESRDKNINLRMTKKSKKMCWYKIGSPRRDGSKKVVFKLRSDAMPAPEDTSVSYSWFLIFWSVFFNFSRPCSRAHFFLSSRFYLSTRLLPNQCRKMDIIETISI